MKYYVHWDEHYDGPYWSLDYAKEKALQIGPDMQMSVEIRDNRGRQVCSARLNLGWHDPGTDPPVLLEMGRGQMVQCTEKRAKALFFCADFLEFCRMPIYSHL